jgi:hypothetical protein
VRRPFGRVVGRAKNDRLQIFSSSGKKRANLTMKRINSIDVPHLETDPNVSVKQLTTFLTEF